MKRIVLLSMFAMLLFFSNQDRVTAQQSERTLLIRPGDSWAALAIRFGTTTAALQNANPHPNLSQQPTVGRVITLPAMAGEPREGILRRPQQSTIWQEAVRFGQNPWTLALENGVHSPYYPLSDPLIFIPQSGAVPREYPAGMSRLELSGIPLFPGRAFGLRGLLDGAKSIEAQYDLRPFDLFIQDDFLVGINGTGAFFNPGEHTLYIAVDGRIGWSQPWLMISDEWPYQALTLTGSAAQIDAESIRLERERLFAIWDQPSPEPLWDGPFALPIINYLEQTASYGVRRAYNGGSYDTYHEGVDFSAFGGTAVYATAAGKVVVSEDLYVRGGTIIIDHGWGIYSGVYHLSERQVAVDQWVTAGELVGNVGTTGLSTGNHLHWDLLVAGQWVDGDAWQQENLACWLLAGFGRSCD